LPRARIEVREKTRALGEHVHLVAHVPDHLRERFAAAVDRLVARLRWRFTRRMIVVGAGSSRPVR